MSANRSLAILTAIARALGVPVSSRGPLCVLTHCARRASHVGYLQLEAPGRAAHTARIPGLIVCSWHREGLPVPEIRDAFWDQAKDGYYLRERCLPEKNMTRLGWSEIREPARA